MPKSGSKVMRSGLYECTRCGEQKVARAGKKMAPCKCGGGDWRLVTATSKARGKTKGGWLSSLFG